MTKRIWNLIVLAMVATAVGCSSTEPATTSADAVAGDAYLASSEPPGALPVGEVRQTAEDKDAVVLVGRIGGSVEPFVDGVAAFTIVDPKVPSCVAEEGCPTPWDYCCEQDQVKENVATVKIVDAEGKLVEQDARTLLGVQELAVVVVQGQAERDAAGNLSVLADQVFVK